MSDEGYAMWTAHREAVLRPKVKVKLNFDDPEELITGSAELGGYSREILVAALGPNPSISQICLTSLALSAAIPLIAAAERQRIRQLAHDYALDPAKLAELLGGP
jgi:hypothetical protein